MKKTMRKIIPAVLMLLISAMLVGTSTYAWFSMNNKVTVTGMTVTTKVSENLLIASDELSSTAKLADSNFRNSLVQEKSGLLEPVSTINGKDFFYTSSKNVAGSGDALNDAYIAYAAGDAFDGNYGLDNSNSAPDALGYIDYVFQIKAINGAEASEIRLTKLDLTYGGSADAGKAYRVAMFYEDITGGTATAAPGTLVAIFTKSGAANFTSGKAVKDATSLDTVTYCPNTTTAKISIAANTTKYYKIVMRLWLEGEDNTCNNETYMNLTDKWALDLRFNLVAATESAAEFDCVQYITTNVTASKVVVSIASDTLDKTAANVITINGKEYYKVGTKQVGGQQLYTNEDQLDGSGDLQVTSHVYVISADGLYPTDVTNQVTIGA